MPMKTKVMLVAGLVSTLLMSGGTAFAATNQTTTTQTTTSSSPSHTVSPMMTNGQNFSVSLNQYESRYAYNSSGALDTIYVTSGQEVHFGDVQWATSGSATPSISYWLVNVSTGAKVAPIQSNTITGSNEYSNELFCYPYSNGVPTGTYEILMVNNTSDVITGNGYAYYG